MRLESYAYNLFNAVRLTYDPQKRDKPAPANNQFAENTKRDQEPSISVLHFF